MSTCVRCGASPLGVAPHLRWWQGVPGAHGIDGVAHKGDLCDFCHEVWLKEREAAASEARVEVVKSLRAVSGAGLKDCSRALTEHGTFEAALEALRKQGLA